jgi:hypothetical protein
VSLRNILKTPRVFLDPAPAVMYRDGVPQVPQDPADKAAPQTNAPQLTGRTHDRAVGADPAALERLPAVAHDQHDTEHLAEPPPLGEHLVSAMEAGRRSGFDLGWQISRTSTAMRSLH